MMATRNITLILGALTLALAASVANAAPQGGGQGKNLGLHGLPGEAGSNRFAYVGPELGIAIPSPAGASSQFAVGADAGYKTPGMLGAGLYFQTSSTSSTVTLTGGSTVSQSNRLTFLGIEGNYFLDNLIPVPNAAIGLKLGPVFDSISGAGVDTSSTKFSFGPRAAYDYTIGNSGFTVGGEVNIMFVTGQNAFNVVNLLGAVKYWF